MRWVLPTKTETFFGESGFQALRKRVEEQDRVTRLIRIEYPAQVMLDRKTGLTVQGLQFNRDAFWQTCRSLSGGLFTVLSGAWDEAVTTMSEAEKQSVLLRAYNSLVQARWNGIVDHRMVVDMQQKTIVGLVGKKYQFVSNNHIMMLVRSQMRHVSNHFHFVKGTQRNRDMLFTLVDPRLVPVGGGLQLRQGLAVVNSETTHRAIFFPKIFYDSATQTYAMEPESKRNRMAHRKRQQFSELLKALVEQVFKNRVEGSKLSNVYRKLLSDAILDDDENLFKRVTDFAVENRVSLEIAAKVASMVTNGKTLPRTQWTVYEAFLRVAEESAGFDRQLRQCAFRLLRG